VVLVSGETTPPISIYQLLLPKLGVDGKLHLSITLVVPLEPLHGKMGVQSRIDGETKG
jgi:hypothetical protein